MERDVPYVKYLGGTLASGHRMTGTTDFQRFNLDKYKTHTLNIGDEGLMSYPIECPTCGTLAHYKCWAENPGIGTRDTGEEVAVFQVGCPSCSNWSELFHYRTDRKWVSGRADVLSSDWVGLYAAWRDLHEPEREEPTMADNLTDAQQTALVEAQERLRDTYRFMNSYAQGEMANFYGREPSGTEILTEVYAKMAPVVDLIDKALEGMSPGDAVARLTDFISEELAQTRKDLETDRVNLEDQYQTRSELLDMREARLKADAEEYAQKRVEEILAKRADTANAIRRGRRRTITA